MNPLLAAAAVASPSDLAFDFAWGLLPELIAFIMLLAMWLVGLSLLGLSSRW